MLIVEEDAAIRTLLAILLGEEGYAVHAPRGWREALNLARRRRIDLVVLNLRLGMPAPDLARALRLAQRRELPVLALCTSDRAEEARQAGAYALLGMPFDIGELLAAVRSGLGLPAPTPEPAATSPRPARPRRRPSRVGPGVHHGHASVAD